MIVWALDVVFFWMWSQFPSRWKNQSVRWLVVIVLSWGDKKHYSNPWKSGNHICFLKKWPNQFIFNCSIVFYLVKSSKYKCTKSLCVFFMFFVGSTHFLWNIPGAKFQAKSNKEILVLVATCSKYWLSHVINISVSRISQALPQQGIDLHPCNQHPCSRLRDPVSWRWNRGENSSSQ